MFIEVRCFAALMAHSPPGNRLLVADGATILEVMKQLELQPDEVKLIFLNGIHAEPDVALNENDRLAFVPAVGGG